MMAISRCQAAHNNFVLKFLLDKLIKASNFKTSLVPQLPYPVAGNVQLPPRAPGARGGGSAARAMAPSTVYPPGIDLSFQNA